MRIFEFVSLAAVITSTLGAAYQQLRSNKSQFIAAAADTFSGKAIFHLKKEHENGEETSILHSDQHEPDQSDVVEAIKYGLNSMKNLYEKKEPQLYSMGLYLKDNSPAKFVAAFNAPQHKHDEYKKLSNAAYAALEATKKFRKKFPLVTRQALKDSISSASCKRKTPLCPPASKKYRTSDGSCNNLKELWWGSSMSTMQRLLPPVYEDGIESVRRSRLTGELLPSARRVSDMVHRQATAEQQEPGPLDTITHMLMQWGQFIDHDVTATGQSSAFNGTTPQCCLPAGRGFQPPELQHPDCLPITVHSDDSKLAQLGVRCLEFVRSGPALAEDDSCGFGPREQLSQVTSFIDASTIYSSSAQQSDSLRIFRNGLLQYGKLQARKPILPRQRDDDDDICVQGSLSTGCFRAGDGRVSEQPALISLHVIFLRLHNQIATKLSAINPHWTDERTFQESRKIVGAIVQHITFHEFLPIVLGQRVMKTFDLELARRGSYYTGYDPKVNPNTVNAFAAAAYRFGHSLVQPSFARYDSGHCPLLSGGKAPVSIHEEFANPVNLETAGSVDRILLGLVNQPAQKRDEFITAELRDHLFQTPGFPHGMDLAAINVQRGRDHGLAPFVDWRTACGLNRIRDWRDLERVVLRPETARKFANTYAAVEDLDLFSAGLAEKPVSDGLVGPTFACIIAQQFRNLRRGDRFWYENPFAESGFTIAQLDEVRRSSLAQILCSTLDSIDTIQPFVMLSVDRSKNQRLSCSNDSRLSFVNLDPWIDKDNNASRVKSGRRQPQKRPNKTRINQHNRVTVNAGGSLRQPHENLTIVINNNAVFSPVYVQDSIYHSPQAVFNRIVQPTNDKAATTTTAADKPPVSTVFSDANYKSLADLKSKPSSAAYWPKNFPTSPDPPTYHLADSTIWMSDLLASAEHATPSMSKNSYNFEEERSRESSSTASTDTAEQQQQNWDSELPRPIDKFVISTDAV